MSPAMGPKPRRGEIGWRRARAGLAAVMALVWAQEQPGRSHVHLRCVGGSHDLTADGSGICRGKPRALLPPARGLGRGLLGRADVRKFFRPLMAGLRPHCLEQRREPQRPHLQLQRWAGQLLQMGHLSAEPGIHGPLAGVAAVFLFPGERCGQSAVGGGGNRARALKAAVMSGARCRSPATPMYSSWAGSTAIPRMQHARPVGDAERERNFIRSFYALSDGKRRRCACVVHVRRRKRPWARLVAAGAARH